MKKVLFLSALLMLEVSHLINAQPVTIDNVSVPVEYYRMPDNPLKASYATYSTDIDAHFGALSMSGFTTTSLEDDYLVLEGYKKINRGGDIEIEASIGDFNVNGERTDIRRVKTKDKNGKEVERSTYAMEIKYSIPLSIRISDKEGRTLEDEYIFRWTDPNTYTTSYYNSLAELDSYWRINRNSKIADLQRDKLSEGFKKIYSLINDKYGYRLINENVRFETIGKKKHPDYEPYQDAVQRIKDAFKSMDANKGLSEIKTSIKPSLDFYASESKKYNSKSKDDVKLKHINLYNQALAYFWLEDFDQSALLVKEIQKQNSKDKDAKRLLAEIDYTRTSLERASRSSRHAGSTNNKS